VKGFCLLELQSKVVLVAVLGASLASSQVLGDTAVDPFCKTTAAKAGKLRVRESHESEEWKAKVLPDKKSNPRAYDRFSRVENLDISLTRVTVAEGELLEATVEQLTAEVTSLENSIKQLSKDIAEEEARIRECEKHNAELDKRGASADDLSRIQNEKEWMRHLQFADNMRQAKERAQEKMARILEALNPARDRVNQARLAAIAARRAAANEGNAPSPIAGSSNGSPE
jgi:vacuolar-type H+-ATPase subunit I/STV1